MLIHEFLLALLALPVLERQLCGRLFRFVEPHLLGQWRAHVRSDFLVSNDQNLNIEWENTARVRVRTDEPDSLSGAIMFEQHDLPRQRGPSHG